uniref:VCBS repeat-containing protein n=1 Tax=candidate division WOR-3 bacterium TaxID=2052148 RepID=A0A7V0Z639_UNCW3
MEFVPRFDLNRDGYLDLFTAGHYGPIDIYWGSSTGYNPNNKLEFPISGGGNCESADLDCDGFSDFVVSPDRCTFFRIY